MKLEKWKGNEMMQKPAKSKSWNELKWEMKWIEKWNEKPNGIEKMKWEWNDAETCKIKAFKWIEMGNEMNWEWILETKYNWENEMGKKWCRNLQNQRV